MQPSSIHDGEVPLQSLLEYARASAAAGDPVGMLQTLHECGLFAGLARRLAAQWPQLSHDDIDFAVCQATDEFYSAVRAGKKVVRIGPYLYKVAHLKALEYYERRAVERAFPDLIGSSDEPAVPAGPYPSLATAEDEELSIDLKRQLALEAAISLIPQLRGGEHVQAVLDYLLRQMAAGRRDIPSAEIAEFIGINSALARKCKERGLRRLERAAQDVGLAGCGFEQLKSYLGYDDNEDDEEDGEPLRRGED